MSHFEKDADQLGMTPALQQQVKPALACKLSSVQGGGITQCINDATWELLQKPLITAPPVSTAVC